LKGARHAGTPNAVWGPVRNVFRAEMNSTVIWRLESREHVDEGRLPRAVRPDQAKDFITFDREVDLLERRKTFEINGKIARRELRLTGSYALRC